MPQYLIKYRPLEVLNIRYVDTSIQWAEPPSMYDVSNSVREKFTSVSSKPNISLSSFHRRNGWHHSRAPSREGERSKKRVENARILQVKQDEDEWTKGSFRQMKDEGTIPKGRPRGKREMG